MNDDVSKGVHKVNCLFELILNVPVNNFRNVGTLPSFYKTFAQIRICLFVCIDALRPSQDQQPCRRLHFMGLLPSIRILGCHDSKTVLHKYNHRNIPKKLICIP